jgi:hypothetical protein
MAAKDGTISAYYLGTFFAAMRLGFPSEVPWARATFSVRTGVSREVVRSLGREKVVPCSVPDHRKWDNPFVAENRTMGYTVPMNVNLVAIWTQSCSAK